MQTNKTRLQKMREEAKRLDGLRAESEASIKALEDRLAAIQPDMGALQANVSQGTTDVEELQSAIRHVEHEIFGTLSDQLGVGSVLELHESFRRQDSAQRKARDKLSDSITRLREELALKEKENPAARLAAARQWLAELQTRQSSEGAELRDIQKRLDQAKSVLAKSEAVYTTVVDANADADAAAKAMTIESERLSKRRNRAQHILAARQNQLEQLQQIHHSLMQRARLEQIDLPRTEGASPSPSTSTRRNGRRSETKTGRRSSHGLSASQATASDFSSSDDDDADSSDSGGDELEQETMSSPASSASSSSSPASSTASSSSSSPP